MHIFITPASLTSCKKCGKAIKPHTVCKYCGYYKGTEFINVLGKLTKKERKLKDREMKSVQKEEKAAPMSAEEMSKKG
jgi:hypothetical protein